MSFHINKWPTYQVRLCRARVRNGWLELTKLNMEEPLFSQHIGEGNMVKFGKTIVREGEPWRRLAWQHAPVLKTI